MDCNTPVSRRPLPTGRSVLFQHYRAKAVRLRRIIRVRSATAEQAQEVLRLLA